MDCLIHYLICLLNAASTSSAALFHLQPCSAACHATRRRNLPTVLLPSLHVFPAFIVLCGKLVFIDCLVPSLPRLPSTWCKHAASFSFAALSYLPPWRALLSCHKMKQDEGFTCCYFYHPLLLFLYLLCSIVCLGCDFACDIYTKV